MANKRIKDLASTATGWGTGTDYIPMDSSAGGTQKILMDDVASTIAAGVSQFPQNFTPLVIMHPWSGAYNPYALIGVDYNYYSESIQLDYFESQVDAQSWFNVRNTSGLEANLAGIAVRPLHGTTDADISSKTFAFDGFNWPTTLNLYFYVPDSSVSFFGAGTYPLPYQNIILDPVAYITNMEAMSENLLSITGGYVDDSTYIDFSGMTNIGNIVIVSYGSSATDLLCNQLAALMPNGLSHSGYLEIPYSGPSSAPTAASATARADLVSWGWTLSIYEI